MRSLQPIRLGLRVTRGASSGMGIISMRAGPLCLFLDVHPGFHDKKTTPQRGALGEETGVVRTMVRLTQLLLKPATGGRTFRAQGCFPLLSNEFLKDAARQEDGSCACLRSTLFPLGSELWFRWSGWHRFALASLAEHFLNLRNKLEDVFCNVCEIPRDGIMVDVL